MQVLLIHACNDRFSYDDYALHRSLIEGDYSQRDLLQVKNDYITMFQTKRVSKVGIVHLDISPEGQVTVIDNIQGVNELVVRKEINPAAVAAKAARKAQSGSKVKLSDFASAVHSEAPNASVQWVNVSSAPSFDEMFPELSA